MLIANMSAEATTRYLYRSVIILRLDDDQVTFRYKESKSKQI
ncbi:hypothetical protein [Psychromonas sp.]